MDAEKAHTGADVQKKLKPPLHASFLKIFPLIQDYDGKKLATVTGHGYPVVELIEQLRRKRSIRYRINCMCEKEPRCETC